MLSTSKRTSLIILGVTSLVFSRVLFSLFNDPEGPNLLIVVGLAAIVFAISMAIYAYYPATNFSNSKKVALSVFVQMVLVAGLYFFLN